MNKFSILLLILFLGCNSSNNASKPEEIMGCMDEDACNYNADATINNETCTELDVCGVCGGGAVSIDVCSSTWDVYYDFFTPIAGFQFHVDGDVTVTNAGGGAAAENGFTVSSGGNNNVIGFSFSGALIPAGSGTLVTLEYIGDSPCLTDLVLSDPDGIGIDVIIKEDCQTIKEVESR